MHHHRIAGADETHRTITSELEAALLVPASRRAALFEKYWA
jgi:hypothetical protein